MQGAFMTGFILLTTVLTVPALHGMFVVQTLNLTQLLIVYGLAFLTLPVIQLLKVLRKLLLVKSA